MRQCRSRHCRPPGTRPAFDHGYPQAPPGEANRSAGRASSGGLTSCCRRIVIFVLGCYGHRHLGCRFATMPRRSRIAPNADRASGLSPALLSVPNGSSTARIRNQPRLAAVQGSRVRIDRRISTFPRHGVSSVGTVLRNQKTRPRLVTKDGIKACKYAASEKYVTGCCEETDDLALSISDLGLAERKGVSPFTPKNHERSTNSPIALPLCWL